MRKRVTRELEDRRATEKEQKYIYKIKIYNIYKYMYKIKIYNIYIKFTYEDFIYDPLYVRNPPYEEKERNIDI